MSRTGPQPAQVLAGYEALDREASARGWPTMGDLLSDEPVQLRSRALAAQLVAPIRCPACGEDAPCCMVGAGRDLHECCCGAHVERRHCCGLVQAAAPATRAYREDAVCPRCGVDRFGVAAEFRELTGGVSLAEYAARFVGLETEEEE